MGPPVLTALNVYPSKSAAGTSVEQWEVDGFGLRYDRRWRSEERRVGKECRL